MRRQLSARLENAHRGRRKNDSVLRFASTDVLGRTRPQSFIGRHRHQNQSQNQHQQYQHQHHQRQQYRSYHCRHACTVKKTNHFNSFRRSFHGLRACYFSNAADITQNDDVNVNADDSVSTVEEVFPNEKFNYLRAVKSWYRKNHGKIPVIFKTKMIPDPDSNLYSDGSIQQIFTATFTCPITNEEFKAGRQKGYYDVDDQNFYTRSKVAIQAISAVVLNHKMNTKEVGEIFDNANVLFVGGDDMNANSESTFRQKLQHLYVQHFKITPTGSQNRFIKQDFVGKTHGGTWWTAEFTCPITAQIFEAVDLPSEVVPDSMKIKKAGQIWYRKKSDSIHASASNAIESIDWNAELHVLEEEKLKNHSRELEKSSSSNEDSKELLRPLLSWYEEQGHGDLKISIDDNFVVTGMPERWKGHTLWTASFLCPLTGERLDAGTINATDAASHTVIDKLIWYTEKDAATLAASQRAYDVFKYRDTGVNDPRFCKEDPSEYSSEACDPSTPRIQGGKNIVHAEIEEEEINDKELTSQGDDTTFEQDEDNFVIEVIPQQINQSSGSYSGSSKTLDVIAQAWIDSTGVPSDKEASEYRIETFQDAFSERERGISRALEWVSRQDQIAVKLSNDRTQFDFQGEMSNLKIANVILSSLADCHQRVPFDSQPTGVEECAAAILESMWSSHSTKPDAQSYAFFLKCLEGETPSDVTAKAQEIVNAMESGHDYNQRSLPKPNDSIYSSLTELKALSGSNLLLESSEMNSLDRNTHLCKLSAMAHDLSAFDIDIATKLIDQMKTLSETNDEPSLQPDVEIYNAPLRWSGGHLWSRLYSRVIPWDSYSEIYKDGFKSDSGIDVQRKHAERVEEWIEIMETKASSDSTLAPNIETYESLIQAWVRCGNQESLLRAETIATKIITGEYLGIQPRIQSFYPILAAWTYSGCEEGPQKVESWIDLIQELVPDIEPRLGFPNVPVMAQISLQRQILNRMSDAPSRTENGIFDSAMKCSKFLQNTIDRYKGSLNSQLQSDIFVLVINAWYNAASAAILNDDLEETRKCFREIQKIANQFDDLLVWLHQVDDSDRARTQFLKLLNLAPSIYGAQLAALSTMERNDSGKFHNAALKDYDRTMHLISIEEKIRRLEEFHLFWGDDGDSIDNGTRTRKGKIDNDPISIFPSEGFTGDLFCTCWSDYIDSSLDVLEKGANDASIGEPDFIRLSLLIARVTSSTTPTVLNSLAKDRIIGKVVTLLENYCGNNQDREAVISTVIQSLQSKRSVTPGSKKIRMHSSTESKDYDANNNDLHEEKGQESGIASYAKRKARRERAPSSSYSSNRTLRRRARPRQAK